MPKYCRICKKKGSNEHPLFAFPVDKTLRQAWIDSTGLTSLNLENLGSTKLMEYKVCYQHFQKSDVFFNQKKSKYDKIKGKSSAHEWAQC